MRLREDIIKYFKARMAVMFIRFFLFLFNIVPYNSACAKDNLNELIKQNLSVQNHYISNKTKALNITNNKEFKYKKHAIIINQYIYELPILNKVINIEPFINYNRSYNCNDPEVEIGLKDNILEIELTNTRSMDDQYPNLDGKPCSTSMDSDIIDTYKLEFKKGNKWCLDTYTKTHTNTNAYYEGIYEYNSDEFKIKDGKVFMTSQTSGDYAHDTEGSDTNTVFTRDFTAPTGCLSLDDSFSLIFEKKIFLSWGD